MPNAFTDMTSGASLGVNLVQNGYDTAVDWELRDEPLHRQLADKRVQRLTNPGETVTINVYKRLTPTTATLSETANPDSVALPTTGTVSVTVEERGRTVIPTLKLRTLTFSDVDPYVAQAIADDQADSLDAVVLAKLLTGTNVFTSNAGAPETGVATNTLVITDVFSSKLIRASVAKLRGRKAPPRKGRYYAGYAHPDVLHDLRAESGVPTAWREPHTYQAVENIWAAETGAYEGVFWVETPRAFFAADGAAGARVYRTIIAGSQALAEVVGIEPHTVIGLPTDPMMRFRPLSWYGLLGWNIFRQESIQRVESGSSIAAL